MLGFDVSTFIFQIVNFLILLAILARFFYRPVLSVMQRRQEEIDARMADAEERARRAEEERERLARQSETAQREAAALIEKAQVDAAHERQRLLEAARTEAASIIDRGRRATAGEEAAALAQLSGRLSETAAAIAGRLVRESAGPAVHANLIGRLLGEGFGLDKTARDQAQLDVSDGAGSLIVESAYPLDETQKQRLREEAAALLGRDAAAISLELRDEPGLLAGARLLIGAVVIDLSLKNLLDALAENAAGEDGE